MSPREADAASSLVPLATSIKYDCRRVPPSKAPARYLLNVSPAVTVSVSTTPSLNIVTVPAASATQSYAVQVPMMDLTAAIRAETALRSVMAGSPFVVVVEMVAEGEDGVGDVEGEI
jgi:hypothetical protein